MNPLTDNELPPTVDLENTENDKAVDEIIANEGDTLLALEDLRVERQQKVAVKKTSRFKAMLHNKYMWLVPIFVILIVFIVPFTRYKLLGLVIKKTITITVIDTKSASHVSNAKVALGGGIVKTDANGQARVRARLGAHQLTITKQYYQMAQSNYFVGFKIAPSASFHLTATGRLVPVTVLNKISGLPVAGATIKVLNTTAKTDAKGKLTIALPADKNMQTGVLSQPGFNPLNVTIQVTDNAVAANKFAMVATGKVYFLSNASGGLDVVKTNLDGSQRKAVLEASGHEDSRTTSLLASRDWRYVALKARREGDQAALYLIDTSTDKVTEFDASNSDFQLIGWYDHDFIYKLSRNGQAVWQTGQTVLKSYDADHEQLNQLDQTQGEGSIGNYVAQNFYNFYIVNNAVVYSVNWDNFLPAGSSLSLDGRNNSIRAVQPSGQNKKDYQTFPAASNNSFIASLYEPNGVYFGAYDLATNKYIYYEYEDQAVKPATVDDATFNQGYPTYLLSPSGKQNFWTELRDGKNTLFIGDSDAHNKKQIATASEYSPYGWYSDAYTLVAKNNSELYIMPSSGLAVGQKPLKISDYYKPPQTYAGYGYGYGGL